MSEQLRESLSAAMDDEADAFELRRMLDEAQGDEALREQWHRYHLVRDVLRDQMQADHPRQLRSNTWQALLEAPDEAEDLDDYSLSLLVSEQAEASAAPTRSTWMGRLAGGAVAAAGGAGAPSGHGAGRHRVYHRRGRCSRRSYGSVGAD